MTRPSWETKSRRELDQIIEQCKSLASRVRAQGALAKCMGDGMSFFAPAQQAAERIDQAAEIVSQFLDDGQDKDSKVVTNCVSRLMRSIGFAGEQEPEKKPKTYDPGEFSGHSRALSVPEMLEFLSLMNKTGLLEVATDDEHFTLELQSGEIVHASSTNAPEDQRLGEVLIQQGALNRLQLKSFLQGPNKGKLGKALQEGALISPEALSRALSYQIQQLFTRLFTAEDAYFVFREGTPQNADAGLRMNVTGLLLESASKIDEGERDEAQANQAAAEAAASLAAGLLDPSDAEAGANAEAEIDREPEGDAEPSESERASAEGDETPPTEGADSEGAEPEDKAEAAA